MTQGELSPSDTSNNNQDWKNVENNKRIRLPNNTISLRTKKTNEPPYFTSSNRYSLLTTNEKMDLEPDYEINETPSPPLLPPPPPIFVTSPINFITLCKNFKQITETEGFFCKFNTKNVKIKLFFASSCCTAIKMLNDNNLEYHTYQTHEEKSYRVVIRNLHHTIPTDYVKEEIENRVFLVKN